MMSPARRRACVAHVVRGLGVSKRKACHGLGQHRSTQRKAPRGADREVWLTADINEAVRVMRLWRALRLTAGRGLGSEPQAAGGAGQVVAGGRVLHPVATRAAEPCLGA